LGGTRTPGRAASREHSVPAHLAPHDLHIVFGPDVFHTESFSSSDSRDIVDGDSGSLADKIDVDVPLGKRVYGHELRTGGFFSRTELFGDLKEGLDAQHLYEVTDAWCWTF